MYIFNTLYKTYQCGPYIILCLKSEGKWSHSQMNPNQFEVSLTTKIAQKTFQGQINVTDDTMVETYWISEKPTIITNKRVK